MNGRNRGSRRLLTAVAALGMTGALITGCDSSDDSHLAAESHSTTSPSADEHSSGRSDQQIAVYTALRALWSQHMEWTYATVDAFFHDQKSLTPTLNRLLKNQQDIGAAITPYYGKAAGDQLTTLLTAHINGAVPVLQAAQAGDKARLDRALAAWQANAKQVADLLSSANPDNWPRSATEPMLRTHITQTTAYAVDLLKGDYASSIKNYDKAEQHMLMLADVLAKGLIAQFPERFS
jgi:hypothetical protein